MTTRTRYFAIVSLLVLTVGLGTGLLAYYVGFPTSAFSNQDGPNELTLVPPDASLVAYADVHHIMSTPLRQKLQTLLPGNGDGQREFEEQTGIKIDSDIDHVVAAVSQTRDASGTLPGSALVIARGRFDVVKIEALMRSHGGTVEQYKGRRVVDGPQTQGQPNLSLAFVEAGLIAVGSSSLVRSAVDRADGGANVTSNTELMTLVRDLDSGNAWAVGRFDVLASQAQLPAGVSQNLPSITWFSASANIDTGVSGIVRAEARDEAAANSLRDLVRGVMALAKLQAPARPEFQTLLNSLQIAGTGKTVALSFDLPAEMFDTLMAGAASTPR